MAIRYYDGAQIGGSVQHHRPACPSGRVGATRPVPSTAQLIGELSAQAERTREAHLAELIAGCTRKAA